MFDERTQIDNAQIDIGEEEHQAVAEQISRRAMESGLDFNLLMGDKGDEKIAETIRNLSETIANVIQDAFNKAGAAQVQEMMVTSGVIAELKALKSLEEGDLKALKDLPAKERVIVMAHRVRELKKLIEMAQEKITEHESKIISGMSVSADLTRYHEEQVQGLEARRDKYINELDQLSKQNNFLTDFRSKISN
ncbi:hypothetical protein FWH58_00570 [Candidatus Saccharibacteria bacterium]|nr:hypothetical protein [Candidatus Saccharibacteria bacterium]